MNTLIVCLNAVLPTFITMLVGYAARGCNLVDDLDVAKINKIAFKTFVPIMLFNNIYSSDFSEALRPKLLAFAVVSVFIAFFLSVLYARLFVKDIRKRGVMIQGIYRSNVLAIGLPIAGALAAGENTAPIAVLMAIIIPIYNVLAVICLESFRDGIVNKREIVLGILKNPLIIASALGLLFSAAKITLPQAIDSAARDLGRAGSPLLLFLLGASFSFDGFRANLSYVVQACIGRLVVVPGIFLTAAALLGVRGLEFVGLLAIFGSATASSSFTMAQQMGGDGALARDIVVATSALSCFTIFLWSILFKSVGVI